MTQKAMKLGIEIVHIVQEAHSAKESGTRKGLEEVLEGIRNGSWNAILTWAPDRLSRNAGDIGRIVDLMDSGKLKAIQTNEQKFANHPDDKFLLMILTSQAKLENDYRGKNVMRGMRAVCHTGKRPGPPPLGYKLWRDPENISAPSKIVLDEERIDYIRHLFDLVGNQKLSSRAAQKIVNADGFESKNGNPVAITTIIRVLHDPFYYGEFEYPKGSGSWYQGTHEPIITKKLYQRTQVVLEGNKDQFVTTSFQKVLRKCRCKKCGGKFITDNHQVTCENKCTKIKEMLTWNRIYKAIDDQCEDPKALKKLVREEKRYDIMLSMLGIKTRPTRIQIIKCILENESRFEKGLLLNSVKDFLRI